MIHFYTWDRPNGYKISILLEELQVPYEVKLVNLDAGEQHYPEFVRISPNSKIPALVDFDGPDGEIALFESGLILMYLADKAGRFLPPSGPERYETLKWTFWQVGGEGPWVGLYFFFKGILNDATSPVIQKLEGDALKRLAVLERRLSESQYLGGEDYSIADIACYVITKRAVTNLRLEGKLGPVPSLDRWLEALDTRPGVQRGVRVPKPIDWITSNGLVD